MSRKNNLNPQIIDSCGQKPHIHSETDIQNQLTDLHSTTSNLININLPLIFNLTAVQTAIKLEFKPIFKIIVIQIIRFIYVPVISIITMPFFNLAILKTIVIRFTINTVGTSRDISLNAISITYIRKKIFAQLSISADISG